MSSSAIRSLRASPSAWCYTFVWIATLADQLLRVPLLGDAAGMAMLLFLLLEFRNQRRYAQVLFVALVAIGMLGVARAADPMALFLAGWRRGASYGAFFFALTTLRDAAETSPLVRRCGRHLVAQPPGRRYAALTGGGHLFGIILSYGAIELLAAMVMRANTLEAAGGSPEVRALRSRRMLMAIYRGFCVMNCWNPINLMTAVVSTAVPAAPMRLLLPIAFVVSIGMAALGWLEDRVSAARAATRGATRPESHRSMDHPPAHHRTCRVGDGTGGTRQCRPGHFAGDLRHAGGAAGRHRLGRRAIAPPGVAFVAGCGAATARRRVSCNACRPSAARRRCWPAPASWAWPLAARCRQADWRR